MPATSDRTLLLLIGAAAFSVVAVLAAWLAVSTPAPHAAAAHDAEPASLPAVEAAESDEPTPVADLVIDVQGGVAAPGVYRLPPGARVADAIQAAGGYGGDADLEAASLQLNLAALLADGQQVRVPRIGEAAGPAAAQGSPSGAGSLVNLNSATPEELDGLPGIGPVTVQKIVAARQQAPFSSLEDAVSRDVLNNGQLEKIRDLATV